MTSTSQKRHRTRKGKQPAEGHSVNPPPPVRIYGLKQEGGELFIKDFANFEGIMKFNAELQRRESMKQIPKTVLR